MEEQQQNDANLLKAYDFLKQYPNAPHKRKLEMREEVKICKSEHLRLIEDIAELRAMEFAHDSNRKHYTIDNSRHKKLYEFAYRLGLKPMPPVPSVLFAKELKK